MVVAQRQKRLKLQNFGGDSLGMQRRQRAPDCRPDAVFFLDVGSQWDRVTARIVQRNRGNLVPPLAVHAIAESRVVRIEDDQLVGAASMVRGLHEAAPASRRTTTLAAVMPKEPVTNPAVPQITFRSSQV